MAVGLSALLGGRTAELPREMPPEFKVVRALESGQQRPL